MMKESRLMKAVSVSLLALGLVVILFPFYLTVITSLKTQQESTINFFALPKSLYLGNFQSVLGRSRFWTYVVNSTVISAVSVALILLFVPMAAYSIARNHKKRYYSTLYVFIITGIFIPFQVIMLPLSVFMTRMHLNNIKGVILFYLSVSFMKGIFLFTNYIRTNVPYELEEAAYIDGASVARTYFLIVLPLIAPMVSTLMIMDFLWIWNDFMLPLILLNRSQANWTLPLFQYNFKSQYTFEYNLAFASYLMAMIPVIAIYVFAQKYIISGLTAGSVKG